ncbi:LysR family transcriptional regulator [Roseateles paludis]|jgi:DNA-binding transcriptional LysR family regulator|uniref:LysR family transcriptional regulator n=1 Tax=Roseateles paludis TaxID=3145238 RepID=A0ABV0G211_9BURK
MDRLDRLRAFVNVVETGSFTRAAQLLDLSKTAVSQCVQRLEAELGVKLLHRSTRRVQATDEGALYYDKVLRLLADWAEADTSVRGAASAPRGRLRVELPSPVAALLVVPALPDFLARYPGIELELGASDRRVDVIADNVDAVLRAGVLEDSSLTARRVGELQFKAYAAPRYLAGAGRPTHPRELAGPAHRVVAYRRSLVQRPQPLALFKADERLELTPHPALTLDDGNAYLAAGLAGLGVLWLTDYMAAAPQARGELVPVLEGWGLAPLPLYWVFPSQRHPSARLRAFTDWVEARLAS